MLSVQQVLDLQQNHCQAAIFGSQVTTGEYGGSSAAGNHFSLLLLTARLYMTQTMLCHIEGADLVKSVYSIQHATFYTMDLDTCTSTFGDFSFLPAFIFYE